MVQCLKCQSERVITGRIVSADDGEPASFCPPNIRFLALALTQGPELEEKGYACLDCGLVWGSTSPAKLARFIQKHCENL